VEFINVYSWKEGKEIPAEIPAEILATMTALQYLDGLSDREAADQVLCITSKSGPRGLKLQPFQELHQSLQDARIHQRSQALRDSYKPRVGIERTIPQSTRAFDLHHTRFIGQIKTRLQHLATATAINLARIYQWWTHQTPDTFRTSSFCVLKFYIIT